MTRNERREPEHQGDVPSDREGLVGDTAASDPLTSSPRVQPSESDARAGRDRDAGRPDMDTEEAEQLGHS